MKPSTSATRPPAQYVVTPGTQFRLVANEYDKNTYAQCNYASYRTLIRCREIRSKESLAKNGGRCEEHIEFAKVIERNHQKEVQRNHAENDSQMQRRRHDPWIASNERISDEEDYLQPMSSLPTDLPDMLSDNLLEDHPLRYAGTFTDKDILRIKMDLVQKDIDNLKEFKKMVVHQAQREHEGLKNEDDDDGPTDAPQRRAHNASLKYGRKDYLSLTTRDPVYKQCCVGPDMDDTLVVAHLVQTMLDNLDNFTPISADTQCTKPALHLTKFCIDHITLDRKQKLFEMCRECGQTAIGGLTPSCSFHIRNKAHSGTVLCRCHRCIPNEARDEDIMKCDIMSSDDDDVKLANLSKIETMVSPMQQFAPPIPANLVSPAPARRYQGTPAQVLRPPQMGPPGSKVTAAQRVVANMREYPGASQQARDRYEAEQRALKQQEEEARTMTCARVRPVDPSQFGSGKKKQQQKQVRPPVSVLPYQLDLSKMPSILTPPVASTSSPGASRPFPGWRNSGMTPRAMHQQHQMHTTRFPVQPHRPRTIPLERAQEPKNADELVEDRGSSPRAAGPEPPRRGVPYYKNLTAYRRTEVPPRPGQPSTSSPSQQSANPNQPQRVRVASRPAPVPPHRAIAAGLNPADAVNPSTPRPSFRPQPQQPGAPIMAMSSLAQLTPAHAQYRQRGLAPHRILASGSPGRVTTSYTVVGSGQRVAAGSSSSLPMPPSRQPPQGTYSNQALDTARNDARFANLNVKTFLLMGNKDLSTMTQEEIDLLSSSSDPPSKRKLPHFQGPPIVRSPTTSPRRELVPPPAAPEDLPAESTEAQPSSAPAPAPASAPASQTPAARNVKKRKVGETAEPLPAPSESEKPEITGEPSIKKTSRRSAEKEKPESQERAKTPKTVKKASPKPAGPSDTPSTSGTPGTSVPPARTPRAAAIAANQAIVHHKPTSATGSSSTASAAQSSQEENPDDEETNPLDLLAELSVALARDEEMIPEDAAPETTPAPTKSTNKETKKDSSNDDASSEPSTSTEKRDGSEEL